MEYRWPPKLSHFVWRACSGALATEGRLYERYIVDDACCNFFPGINESIVYSVFHCFLVSPI